MKKNQAIPTENSQEIEKETQETAEKIEGTDWLETFESPAAVDDLEESKEPEDTNAADEEEEEAKPRKVLNTVINVVLIVAIVIAAICTYVSFVSTSGNGVPNILGLRLLSIQTDSMYDTILPGDLIIDTAIKDPADLRPDDIITYWTVINGERVLNTHRIVNIYNIGGDKEQTLVFETKGDNNTSADPLTVHESELVGIYRFRIPGLGKVFDYLQTSTGFLLVVVIPVFIFFLYHLVQFFRVLFEYQGVKNRLAYEQERGKNEDIIAAAQVAAAQKSTDVPAPEVDRAAIEAELREKLRAELLASMGQDIAAMLQNNNAASAKPADTTPAAPAAPAEETPAQEEESQDNKAE